MKNRAALATNAAPVADPSAPITEPAVLEAAAQPDNDTVAASRSGLDVATLDASHDDRAPNAPVSGLAAHCEQLAAAVDCHAGALALAKLRPGTGALLRAAVALLREQQTRWTIARAASRPAARADARRAAWLGHDDLYRALRLFADDRPAVQAALDGLSEQPTDDQLLEELDLLLTLAAQNADALAGTDINATRVAAIRRSAEAFRGLRAGAPADGDDEDADAAEVTGDALAARRLRNRVYWFLANLDRDVCRRGRYIFRRDERKAALFRVYSAPRSAPKAAPDDA